MFIPICAGLDLRVWLEKGKHLHVLQMCNVELYREVQLPAGEQT